MIHRVRSLVTVLALGLPAIAAADRLQEPPKQATTPVSAFLQQDRYTYCDVKILSALWKQSIADSKVTVGAKIQARNDLFLSAELVKARQAAQRNPAARCRFSEAGFSYDDAVKLARAWGNSAAQAKALAEDKILAGAEKMVRDLVKKGSGGGPNDPVSTFLKQDKFTYCDVKLLSALWKASASDAKARIGVKIQTKNEGFLNTELASARNKHPNVRCSYNDAGLTYEDVEKIARLWQISVTEAKTLIEQKATAGGGSFLREVVGAPGTRTEAELNAFLNQDKYTYCDAKMIAGMWKQSIDQGKTLIGGKLMMKNARALTKIVNDARAFARKNADARCSFHDAGFTYDDAVKLAAVWKKTEAEAKARVEDKILKGQEASVRAALKLNAQTKPIGVPPPGTKPNVMPPPTKSATPTKS